MATEPTTRPEVGPYEEARPKKTKRPLQTEGEEEEVEYEGGKGKQFHSQFVDRMWNYRLLNYAYEKVHNAYEMVKNANPVVNYVVTKAENNVSKVATPITYSVLNRVYSTGEPLLTELDNFACRQLDRFEGSYIRPYETLTLLPYTVLDKTLNVAEGTLDYFLPPLEDAREKEKVYEEQTKQEFEKAKALEGKGQEMERVKSNFHYLRVRGDQIAASAFYRARERLARFPLVVPVMDRLAYQIIWLRTTFENALNFATHTRTLVYNYCRDLVVNGWAFFRSLTMPVFVLTWEVVRSGFRRTYANLVSFWNFLDRFFLYYLRETRTRATALKARAKQAVTRGKGTVAAKFDKSGKKTPETGTPVPKEDVATTPTSIPTTTTPTSTTTPTTPASTTTPVSTTTPTSTTTPASTTTPTSTTATTTPPSGQPTPASEGGKVDESGVPKKGEELGTRK